MDDPLVTIVVTHRERFAYNAASLAGIYKNTSPPFKLVYIDTASPPSSQHYLEALASEKGFTLIRVEHFLSSNEAYNLGRSQVDTKYVVFVDNDLCVTPCWLEKLVQCAEETEAWVVGPLCLEGKLENQIIHTAGGDAHFEIENGHRTFRGPLRFAKRKFSEVQNQLRRETVESVEFHCMLVRNEIFDIIGPLDEKFIGISDHQDICLRVRAAGGSIYLEPAAVVTFPHLYAPLEWSDLPLFFHRWNDARMQENVDYMRDKWGLPHDDVFIRRMSKFTGKHRRYYVRLWFPWRLHKIGRIALYPLVFLTERLCNRIFRPKAVSTDRSDARQSLSAAGSETLPG